MNKFYTEIPWETIYVSRLQKLENGQVRVIPIAEMSAPVPAGSPLLDAVGKVLATTKCLTSEQVADCIGVDHRRLGGAIYLLAGVALRDLVVEYRSRQLKELIQQTNLTSRQLADCMGFASVATLDHFCRRKFKATIRQMRK